MAKGYPDFFGFSMFPYYGTLYQLTDNVVIAPTGRETIVDITAKGILFSGSITITGFVKGDEWPLYVGLDADLVSTILIPWWIATPTMNLSESIFTLEQFSFQNSFCRIVVREGISFRDHFYIIVDNNAALSNITVDYDITYHLVAT